MRNPITLAKEKFSNFVYRNSFLIASGVLYAVAPLALNTVLYAGYAAQEGVQRLCGTQTVSRTGRLKESTLRKLVMPGTHGEITTGTFILDDGKELEVVDGPVVTEGKLVPNMRDLKKGQKYNFRTFGYNLVDAKRQETK